MSWWRGPLESVIAGRRVIVAGGPAAMWTTLVTPLRELGATDVLVVATEGTGAGPQPECQTVIADVGTADTFMARLRASVGMLGEPPADVVDAVEAFDADRSAVVFGNFLTETPTLVGRPLVAHRHPEWVALEDKTVVDALLDQAGVTREASLVVPIDEAAGSWRQLDRGDGTVWAADARDGFHGGGTGTRWVTDDGEAGAAADELGQQCDQVRVMGFLEGIATSVHGIVLPDGVAVLRPVELITLRQGHRLRYTGCATFWDPPDPVRDEMRRAARRVGELLRADVDFRGAFTLDGVATTDGFRPTELNPRFGVGLSVMTRGLDVPLVLVLDIVVAGTPLGLSADELEQELLAEADASRSGGTWQLDVATPVEVSGRPVSYDGGEWRWARPDEPSDGDVVAGHGFARVNFVTERTPIGPSVGERSMAFWRFADAELGTDVGPLTAAVDVTSQTERLMPSTRP